MKEIKAIIEAYQQVDFTIRQAALATVARVKGSSYRSPGARMLITDDGRWVGSISGGCLEGDALRKARKVMQSGVATLVTYDTMDDNNNSLGIGLGCNGVIDVLIEPIDPENPQNPITLLQPCIQFEEAGAMATVFESEPGAPLQPGDKLMLGPGGELTSTITDDKVKGSLIELLTGIRNQKKFATKEAEFSGKQVNLFLELLQPSINLMIFGGGFDAKPVTELASVLGWPVTVADECVAHIAPVNFPQAHKVVHCQRDYVHQHFKPTPYTAVVLMSHSYDYDLAALREVLKTNVPYIGMLGPKKRTDKMFAQLAKEGYMPDTDTLHRIHSPIGLDIGAETPEEIAVSIIAEIQSKFTNRAGGFLKYKQGPIHSRGHGDGQVFKQAYLADGTSKNLEKLPKLG